MILDVFRRRAGALAVATLFTALTIALTWPQAIRPTSIPNGADAWLNLWRIAWIAHQLRCDPLHLFDGNMHYPERGTLAYSDAILLQGVLGAPLSWIGMSTPVIWTLLSLGSFVFAALAAWSLVRALTGSQPAGILAGIVFAFSPFRFDHYTHLELLWGGWIPLVFLAVHRTVERPTTGNGMSFGALLAAQAYSCIYYVVFLATVLVPFTVILIAGESWLTVRRATVAFACGIALFAVLVFPYLLEYQAAQRTVGHRSSGEVQLYSAGPLKYLSATPENWLYGRLTARFGRLEKRLFPGTIACLLAAFALWPPLHRRRMAYVVAAVVAVDLSFGLDGLTFGWLRDHVVPYQGLRAAARAGQIALLMIAVLAGYGLARLEVVWLRRPSRRARMAIGAILAFAVLEYVAVPLALHPAPTTAGPVEQWLASHPGGVVAEFPMPQEHSLPFHDDEYTYRSTFHWHRIVNGYSGNAPASYIELTRSVRLFPSPEALKALSTAGVRFVVVHERFYASSQYESIRKALDTRADLRQHGPIPDEGAEAMIYEFVR